MAIRLTDFDDVEIRRKCTANGQLDELQLIVERWRAILVGWEDLLDKDGKPLEFEAKLVAFVEDDGRGGRRPGGVGPALGTKLSDLLLKSGSERLQRAAGAMKTVIFAYEEAGLDQLDRSFPTEMEQLFESTGRTLQGSLSSAIIAGIRDGSDGAKRILDNLATNPAARTRTSATGPDCSGRSSRCSGRWPTAASWTGRRCCSPASAGLKRCGLLAKGDAGDRSRCTSSTRRSWTRANSWRAVWRAVVPRCVS